jgi:hypothetical protein
VSPADGARARVPSFDGPELLDGPEVLDGPELIDRSAVVDPAELDDSRFIARRPIPRRQPTRPRAGSTEGSVASGATRWAERPPRRRRPEQPPADHAPRPERQSTDRRVDDTAVRGGVRLNGLWCAVLLVVGVAAALALAGALSWQPGVAMTIALAAVGVGVALLAGRGGGFEAGILPGTVVIVVGAFVVALDSSALGGAVAGLGPVSRVWQAIGLLAPAAATTWVCALVTLALRRAGLLRRF